MQRFHLNRRGGKKEKNPPMLSLCSELVGSPRAVLCWVLLRQQGPTEIFRSELGTDQQYHLTEKRLASTSSTMPGESEEEIQSPGLQLTLFPPRSMLTPCRRSEGSLNHSWVPYVHYSCFHLLNYHEDTLQIYTTQLIYISCCGYMIPSSSRQDS